MKLNCNITDQIREEFGALWRCEQFGETLEISTPYRMPDSTLFTLFLTERTDRYIACDGGRIWELLLEHCEIPTKDLVQELRAIAIENGMKEGTNNGTPLFFKDCREKKLISSIAFDVANFATLATNVLMSLAPKSSEVERETNFITHAHEFIEQRIRPGQTFLKNAELQGLPGTKFNALVRSVSGVWVFAYVGGNSTKDFKRIAADAALNFKEARQSQEARKIKATIPMVNTAAHGYNRPLVAKRIEELEEYAMHPVVTLDDADTLIKALAA